MRKVLTELQRLRIHSRGIVLKRQAEEKEKEDWQYRDDNPVFLAQQQAAIDNIRAHNAGE